MTLWCHTDHNDDFLTCSRLAMCMNVDPFAASAGTTRYIKFIGKL